MARSGGESGCSLLRLKRSEISHEVTLVSGSTGQKKMMTMVGLTMRSSRHTTSSSNSLSTDESPAGMTFIPPVRTMVDASSVFLTQARLTLVSRFCAFV